MKLLQWNKVDLCDLYKKIAACITDEGELESEIYQAEEQETPLLDKIAKVNFATSTSTCGHSNSGIVLKPQIKSNSTEDTTTFQTTLWVCNWHFPCEE